MSFINLGHFFLQTDPRPQLHYGDRAIRCTAAVSRDISHRNIVYTLPLGHNE